MKLNDPLVNNFTFQGEEYEIYLAFDNVLDVFDILNDERLFLPDRVSLALVMLTSLEQEDLSDIDIMGLWEYIMHEFISPEIEDMVEYDLEGKPMPLMPKDKQMDIIIDAELIFSSFVQAYGINLFKSQGELTWIEFKSLLNGLPQDTALQQVIQIRMWEPPKGCDPKEKQRMIKLQNLYSLREEENDE